MDEIKIPKSCEECNDKEWCDSFFGGVGCAYKDNITKEAFENMKHDEVKEPYHYKQGSFETIDEMLLVFGPKRTYDFCIMNAWKYRARASFKGSKEKDMLKSNQYLEMAKQIAEANFEKVEQVHLIKLKEE